MSVISQLTKNMMENNGSFIKFLVIGALTAGIYISLFIFLFNVLHENYQVAVSVSYAVSVVLHFSANRKFTFKNRTSVLAQQLPRYLILLLINYVITLIVMYLAMELFHIPSYIGIVLTIAATFMLSYLLSKFWIFQAM